MIIFYFLLVIALIDGLLLGVLAIELWTAFLPTRRLRRGERLDVAVIVPAHNESDGITRTLESLKQQSLPTDRLLVVADNCTDDTADCARATGVEVIERFKDTARGKGYAIDFGIQHLRVRPPAVVVICDADCTLEPGSLDSLASQVSWTGSPAQALYLMRQPKIPGPESSVSAFAFLIKNWVRPRALDRAGLPVMLTGSGMAFPWSAIATIDVASGEIVEDLAIGLKLTRRRLGPKFCESAVVWSELPANPEAVVAQRTRWEHGYLATIFRDVPKLVRDFFKSGRITLLAVALDLSVPPLALLVLVSALVASLTLIYGLATNLWQPFLLVVLPGLSAALGLMAAWYGFARTQLPAKLVLSIPLYVLKKLNIYRRFVTKRQQDWVRTQR
ncbi:Poly-beta-1,6-N-acetyl-D-glucosamine synthase [Roseimaritima multifibrata]|uniref:Poly-beta-1,6-N-acetyl-D-glucosamine synthase n=1 Tax=Roseimaritima multifibrata TaxID=1930274 RepID=A0A517MMK5_9BACT|nr:glycosyltransferase family 2 protein [Roseimaritima multifibrata]QDS96090.1 Poly-beta-1,6-N-acetyl-D-glucosamine synthase [Roseimaritima multifibrata]